jgi:hypothetical protein
MAAGRKPRNPVVAAVRSGAWLLHASALQSRAVEGLVGTWQMEAFYFDRRRLSVNFFFVNHGASLIKRLDYNPYEGHDLGRMEYS